MFNLEVLTLSFVFILSTLFFLYQHSSGISWDFSVYVLNAKYMFSEGEYFEWLRPPLTSFIIGILGIFGWGIAEYLFIIFTSCLFLFSCIKISKKLRVNKEIYYLCCMNLYTLAYSFSAGSELLSLSLLQLFIAYIDEWFSGFFLSLAFLARYNNILFFPLIFFQKDKKKILFCLLTASLTVLPWLAYSFIKTGDPFISLTDFYLLNIKFRSNLRQPIQLEHFLFVCNYFILFIIIGFFKFLESRDRMFWIIGLFMLLTLFSYFLGAFKDKRYLFNLVLPLSYFSSHHYNKKIFHAYILLFLFSFATAKYFQPLENALPYKKASESLEKCETRSNAWVFLNYYGFKAGPIPWKHQVAGMIDEGVRFVLFKRIKEPDFGDFWENFPKIEENEEYFVVGNASFCKKQEGFSKTYFEQVSEACGIEISRYEAMFSNKKLCESIKYCEEFKQALCK
mgnify:CR=1 FL=1